MAYKSILLNLPPRLPPLPPFIFISVYNFSSLELHLIMQDIHTQYGIYLKTIEHINYIKFQYARLPRALDILPRSNLVKIQFTSFIKHLTILNDNLHSLHPRTLNAVNNEGPRFINYLNKIIFFGIASEIEFTPIPTREILETETLRDIIKYCYRYIEIIEEEALDLMTT